MQSQKPREMCAEHATGHIRAGCHNPNIAFHVRYFMTLISEHELECHGCRKLSRDEGNGVEQEENETRDSSVICVQEDYTWRHSSSHQRPVVPFP
jgi:hypothetical protein